MRSFKWTAVQEQDLFRRFFRFVHNPESDGFTRRFRLGAVQLIRTLPFSLLESPTVTAKASPCPMQTTGGNRNLNLRSPLRAAYLFGFARDGWCKLRRLLLTFALLSLLFGSRAMASNPQDLRFQLGLVKETPAYHRGESIVIEISYSTSTKDKYQRSSNSALQGIVMHIVPFDGVRDLNVLRFEHGWAGSIIGGMGLLSSQPTIQQIDLCSLYRFERPGHYGLRSCHNTFLQLGDYRRAAEFAALDPLWAGTPPTQRLLATLHSGDRQAAVRAFAELSPNERFQRPLRPEIGACLTNSAGIADLTAKWEVEVMANRDPEPKFIRASRAYMACGEAVAAPVLRMMKRAVEQNYCAVEALDRIPGLAPLRSKPEFQQIRAQAQRCHEAFEAHRAQVDRATR